MLKYIGIILIAITAAGCGYVFSQSCRDECRRLAGFLKLARFIRARIECFNQPLAEIYSEFTDDSLDECGFIERLRGEGFAAAIESGKKGLGLRDSLVKILSEFGSELGKSFSAEQLRHCDIYIKMIEEQLSALEDELPKKTKTIRALTVAAAVMTVIILI